MNSDYDEPICDLNVVQDLKTTTGLGGFDPLFISPIM